MDIEPNVPHQRLRFGVSVYEACLNQKETIHRERHLCMDR